MAGTALAPPAAALSRRDPEFIRRTLPVLWPPLRAWFRPDIRGLERIPADGPVLLVGNHSGGNMSPDTLLLTLALVRRFGPERPFFQLAHHLVVTVPWLRLLARYGTVEADPATAAAALAAGAAVLVYPGGDWEVHRPVWERNRVELHGRRGFVRLALETGAPVVPVVSAGGQETALFLSRGAGLARALRLHRLLRVDVLPIAVAAPWGLDVGDLLGHLPLPAKIQIEALEPVDLAAVYGDDVDAAYAGVAELMQAALDRLAARRHLPVLG